MPCEIIFHVVLSILQVIFKSVLRRFAMILIVWPIAVRRIWSAAGAEQPTVEIPAAEGKISTTHSVIAILGTLIHVRELSIGVISEEERILAAEAHVLELVVVVMIIILIWANDLETLEIRSRNIRGGS